MTTFIALLLAVSMLSGCSNASVTNIKSTPAEFSVSAILAEAKPEAVTYTVELQTVENTAEAEDGTLLVHYKFELPVMTAVRKDGSEILQAANETERAALLIVESFNSQFADWLDRGEFSALAAAAEEDRTWQVLNGGEWIGAYELGLTCDLYQTGELISVAAEYYSYTGGAHPNTSLLAWNFDLTTGQFFTPLSSRQMGRTSWLRFRRKLSVRPISHWRTVRFRQPAIGRIMRKLLQTGAAMRFLLTKLV